MNKWKVTMNGGQKQVMNDGIKMRTHYLYRMAKSHFPFIVAMGGRINETAKSVRDTHRSWVSIHRSWVMCHTQVMSHVARMYGENPFHV